MNSKLNFDYRDQSNLPIILALICKACNDSIVPEVYISQLLNFFFGRVPGTYSYRYQWCEKFLYW